MMRFCATCLRPQLPRKIRNRPRQQAHERLAVFCAQVVEQAKQSPAAVRILNASGSQVRSLYSGDLKPGKYRFEWENPQGGDAPSNTPEAGGGTRRSRGHWGTLDNVIGGPGVWQRMSGDLRP